MTDWTAVIPALAWAGGLAATLVSAARRRCDPSAAGEVVSGTVGGSVWGLAFAKAEGAGELAEVTTR